MAGNEETTSVIGILQEGRRYGCDIRCQLYLPRGARHDVGLVEVWYAPEKESLSLDLGVLLGSNVSVLRDCSTIIIGRLDEAGLKAVVVHWLSPNLHILQGRADTPMMFRHS